MEAGLELRLEPDLNRIGRLYKGLYAIAEAPFVRAGSQCLPKVTSHAPPTLPPPTPYPGRATLATPPDSAQAESQNESQTQTQTDSETESNSDFESASDSFISSHARSADLHDNF